MYLFYMYTLYRKRDSAYHGNYVNGRGENSDENIESSLQVLK